MKKILSLCLLLIGLAACQPAYYYHFPTKKELRSAQVDSLRWQYSGGVPVKIPVADDRGHTFWLDVNDKTKLQVKSIHGEEYLLNLRSIKVSDEGGGIFGSGEWTGFDVREHVNRTFPAQEINTITVISNEAASTPLSMK